MAVSELRLVGKDVHGFVVIVKEENGQPLSQQDLRVLESGIVAKIKEEMCSVCKANCPKAASIGSMGDTRTLYNTADYPVLSQIGCLVPGQVVTLNVVGPEAGSH